MRRARTLEQLKDIQRLCGADVGSRMCVWADWPHIQLTATLFGFAVIIRDVQADYTHVIRPESPSTAPATDHATLSLSYLCVVRVDGCHYNMVMVGQHALLTAQQVREHGLDDGCVL